MENRDFPDIIGNLPEADIPIEGLRSHLFQGKEQQILFMAFDEDVIVPEHSHAAQWGVILDGEIELTINGETRSYGRGDEYFIPEGIPHSAVIKGGYRDVTLFNQKDRYLQKTL